MGRRARTRDCHGCALERVFGALFWRYRLPTHGSSHLSCWIYFSDFGLQLWNESTIVGLSGSLGSGSLALFQDCGFSTNMTSPKPFSRVPRKPMNGLRLSLFLLLLFSLLYLLLWRGKHPRTSPILKRKTFFCQTELFFMSQSSKSHTIRHCHGRRIHWVQDTRLSF